MWSRRVWRELDLRQKINLPLFYPTTATQGYESLYDVLVHGIMQDSLTAYGIGPLGMCDDFSNPLSSEDVNGLISHKDTIYTYDLNTEEQLPVHITDSIRTDDVTRYRIKEDWLFDRSHSRMIVRIIGIAPMREIRSEMGVVKGYRPLFWVNFEEARPILSRAPVLTRTIHDLNYDDLFAKRFFHGYIVKVSNVYDRYISHDSNGIDALLEGAAIEEEILNFEQDFWSH